MELFTVLLGIGMMYVWVHSVIIVSNVKKEDRTNYQNGVIIASLVFLSLWVIGVLSGN